MAYLLVIIIALGLATRYFPMGNPIWDAHLGDVLWGAALYCAVALVVKRRRFLVATVIAVAVEFFKLTEIPAKFSYLAPVRWLLGTTFSWHNIPLYILGIALVALLARRFRITR